LAFLAGISASHAAPATQPQLTQVLSEGWRFQPDPKGELLQKGVTKAGFDDAAWPRLTALRQWQLQPGTPFPDYHGIAWYRKTFDAPQVKSPQRLLLYFGGADGNAVVYLNGKEIGTHQTAGEKENYSGWNTPFVFDITQAVRPKDNILVVQLTSKPALASGLHNGVSLWVAEASQELFKSLLPNPYWAVWGRTEKGLLPAGWSLYCKPELRKDVKTARVKTPEGTEGLSITLTTGNCNLFPSAPMLQKPGIHRFTVRLVSPKKTSVRIRMYLPRPGEVSYQAKEYYTQKVDLKPNEPQRVQLDTPTTEPNRTGVLYISLYRPEGVIVSDPMLGWVKK
jgi:hypothetical protein